jgi:hypothetical protein
LNPGRRGGKPATNRFSYGAAKKEANLWYHSFALVNVAFQKFNKVTSLHGISFEPYPIRSQANSNLIFL